MVRRRTQWRDHLGHLLQQTSDWSGTLWDIHDWADRPEGDDPANRPLHAPGTRYKYNDVRVNLLALALLELQREPAPQVFKRRVMDPIGASSTWRWEGYGNSWITLDGLRMQSVSGGGHFGGGMVVNTRDLARFGLLMQRDGVWAGRRLLSSDWIARSLTPSPIKPDYGYLWWLKHRTRGDPGRTGRRVLGGRLRRQSCVRRSRTRPGHRHALDA